MGTNIGSRLQHAWNAFLNRAPTENQINIINEPSYSSRPDRTYYGRGDRTIIMSIYNRIAIDTAAIQVHHVRLDDKDRFLEIMDSSLEDCLNLSANLDQTGRAFMQDAVYSLIDEGCIALVPIETTETPTLTGSFDITNIRVGEIREWKPSSVKVKVYDERSGEKKEIWLNKKMVGIVENPLYAVMNAPNSTAKRLRDKINLLDRSDQENSSGKLNMILQVPYLIKGELKKKRVSDRLKAIENQLTESPRGIAYIDSTEKITQLNRPMENGLQEQIESLTVQLYSQLGITKEVMEGTADEKTMINYYNRTIEPILASIVDEMKRKFLTKYARTQKQSIVFYREPFKLVPVSELAEIADKFTRNEILTSNEVRQEIGYRPSDDKTADELRNSNLNRDRNTVNEEMLPKEGGNNPDEQET